MKKHPFSAIALLSLLLFVSCESQKPGSNATNDSIIAPIDTVDIRVAESECGDLKPGQFCAQGLDFLLLGDSLTWNNHIQPTLPDAVMKDTVFTEISLGETGGDTVSWFAKLLRFPDGMIVLDADFETGQRLGRIRIESGRYHHISGLRVGSSGKDLKAFTMEAYVVPFEEFKVMEIIVPYHRTKMIFHVPQEGILQAGKTEYTMADIPDNAKIVRIVLM
jgi:hypothetical protein